MKLKILFNGVVQFGIEIIFLMIGSTNSVIADEAILSLPGQMVDIGTHYMHIHCVGNGHPTVVMDAGLGSASLEWVRVQQLLEKRVQVCIFDRTGYGWSEVGPMPRTSSRNADELFILLKQALITGPYVLVGHSYGGYNIRLFASRYPDMTSGLVFIDASHPDQVARFEAPLIGLSTAPDGGVSILKYSMPTMSANLPEKLKPTIRSQLRNSKTRVAAGSEFLNFRKSAAQVQEAGPLPNVPLVVVTRGMRVWPHTKRGNLMEQLWMDLQTELATGSPRSAHLIANRSGHQIHLEQPELVANAVALVINDIQECCHWSLSKSRAFSMVTKPTQLSFINATWRSNHLVNGLSSNVQTLARDTQFSNYELNSFIAVLSTKQEKTHELLYK